MLCSRAFCISNFWLPFSKLRTVLKERCVNLYSQTYVGIIWSYMLCIRIWRPLESFVLGRWVPLGVVKWSPTFLLQLRGKIIGKRLPFTSCRHVAWLQPHQKHPVATCGVEKLSFLFFHLDLVFIGDKQLLCYSCSSLLKHLGAANNRPRWWLSPQPVAFWFCFKARLFRGEELIF